MEITLSFFFETREATLQCINKEKRKPSTNTAMGPRLAARGWSGRGGEENYYPIPVAGESLVHETFIPL
jgi:hypothetical protein